MKRSEQARRERALRVHRGGGSVLRSGRPRRRRSGTWLLPRGRNRVSGPAYRPFARSLACVVACALDAPLRSMCTRRPGPPRAMLVRARACIYSFFFSFFFLLILVGPCSTRGLWFAILILYICTFCTRWRSFEDYSLFGDKLILWGDAQPSRFSSLLVFAHWFYHY